MSKLIIVEGPDSSGKTTLAKFIARQNNAFYFHASGRERLKSAMWDYHLSILESSSFNMNQGHVVVWDRHWPSERCYAAALRPHRLADYPYKSMQEMVAQFDPIYVYCNNSSHAEGWKKQQELHQAQDHRYTEEQYYLICEQYDDVFNERFDGRVINYQIEKSGHLLLQFNDLVMQ